MISLFWQGLLFVALAVAGKLSLGRAHWGEALATVILWVALRYLIYRLLEPPEEHPVLTEVPDPVKEVPFNVRLGRFSTGVVIGATCLLVVMFPHSSVGPDWRTGFNAGLSVLVLASAPGFLLSGVATFGAVQRRARQRGMVLHHSTALENLARAETMVFNKTGTLTEGTFRISEVASLDDRYEPQEVLCLAAALESRTDHPLARSLLQVAHRVGLKVPRAMAVETWTGLGLKGEIGGSVYYLGSPRFMRQLHHNLAPFEADLRESQELGETVLFLSVEDEIIGLITASDPIRPEAASTLAALRELGFRQLMLLTGDDAGVPETVSPPLGLDHQHTNLRPPDKISYLESLQARHQVVAMVAGDVQEAHTLAQADVGILLQHLPAGTELGFDIEVEGLSQLPEVVHASRRWVGLMRRNLFIVVGATISLLLGIGLVQILSSPLPLYLGVLGQETTALAIVLPAQRKSAGWKNGAGEPGGKGLGDSELGSGEGGE